MRAVNFVDGSPILSFSPRRASRWLHHCTSVTPARPTLARMPKNPHPPRGGGGSKKSAPPPSGAEDTSYIVFSNSKGDSKKGKKADNAAKNDTNDKGKVKTKGAPEQPEDAPKKPDVRTIIGGASWTGKLPVNMLSEHCQKQKWEKPEYTMVYISRYACSCSLVC